MQKGRMKLGKLFINTLKFGMKDGDDKPLAEGSEEALKNKIYSSKVINLYKSQPKKYNQFGDQAQQELDRKDRIL